MRLENRTGEVKLSLEWKIVRPVTGKKMYRVKRLFSLEKTTFDV